MPQILNEDRGELYISSYGRVSITVRYVRGVEVEQGIRYGILVRQ